MSKKKEFIDYVKNGGDRILCSPQIGCGAGYDAKLHNLQWISSCSPEHTVKVTRRYAMHPLYNIGIDPIMHCKNLGWVCDSFDKNEKRAIWKKHIETPFGRLERWSEERPRMGSFNIRDAVNNEHDLNKLEYVLDTAIKETDFSCYTEYARSMAEFFNDEGPVSFQWGMQPYELFSFANTITNALLAIDFEERFFSLMDKALKLDYKIIDALEGTGIDFVFLGGPGVEVISPSYYEKFIVPYSKLVTKYAHEKGFLIYSHICSPIEPMLTMGYYNEMGIDLFETLSPKPEGNIISLADAFSKLNPDICTRGNVSLSLMINGTPKEIKDEVKKIIDAAQGRKHIIAASDYLVYDVPEENVIALCEAV